MINLDPTTLQELKMIPGVFPRHAGAGLYRVRCTPDVAFVLDEKRIPYELVRRPSRVLAPLDTYAPRLLAYQRDGADQLRYDAVRALFWGTGVRKTATSLTAALPPALIVTRSAARDVFPRDGAWCWPGAPFTTIMGARKDSPGKRYSIRRTNRRLARMNAKGANVLAVGSAHEARHAAFVVVGWDTLAEHAEDLLALRRWPCVIWDESHMACGRKSARTKAAHLIAHAAERSWLLTATPQPNRVANLPAQLALMDRDAWGSSYQFVMRYADAKWNTHGGLDTKGQSYTEELQQRLSYWASVKSKTDPDVASTLPQGTRIIMRVDAARKVAKMPTDRVRRGREALLAWAAEIKLPDVTARAVECLVEGEKVVLVGGRKAWIPRAERMVLKGLRKASRLVQERAWVRSTSGKDPIPKRLDIVAEYMALTDTACLIATIDSIGQSIDVQDTDRTIFAFLPDTPLGVIQIEGRFVRHGGRTWTGEYWIADGTVDEIIEEMLLEKFGSIVNLGLDTTETGLQSVARETEDEIAAGLSAWLAERADDIDGAVLDMWD